MDNDTTATTPLPATPVSTLTNVQRENKKLMEEIQKLMIHNTKLQRELMTLNESREHIIASGHERVAALTDELKQVDKELETVRSDCDHIISVICTHKELANMRSLGDLRSETIEEEDFQSDHSTTSTASSSSFHSASQNDWKSKSHPSPNTGNGTGTSSSRGGAGRPPLSKKSIDIDEDHIPQFSRSASAAASSSSSSSRETIMNRITRSVKKAQSMPQVPDGARPSVQHEITKNSPILTYKANAMLRATQSHLSNFRRHSGPYRRNQDTVVL